MNFGTEFKPTAGLYFPVSFNLEDGRLNPINNQLGTIDNWSKYQCMPTNGNQKDS